MTAKSQMKDRLISLVLCFALLISGFPFWSIATKAADDGASRGSIYTVADPETLTRPEAIYGDNTLNAGKITVGKSVSDEDITVNGQKVYLDGDNNFLVTITQTAQVMGLASQTDIPVDVVFVLDTSGSMDDNDRAEKLVEAANSAIKTLMETNEANRVGVVAFSSEDYGNGSSNGAAANVLSSLAHYTGDAAENHLRWVNSNAGSTGNDKVYVAGRDTVTIRVNYQNRQVNAFRHGKNGGTNIQAGIVEGAKLLENATNTIWTNPDTGEKVTRIPFLIVLSDGQPTYTYDDEEWYDPTITGYNAANEQGPGSGSYEGNGFIAALTAAYYKGVITEHYYGDKANDENHCFVYTMGVEIDALDDTTNNWGQTTSVFGVNQALAQITLDPATNTVGSYAENNAKSYWNFGNTAFQNNQNSSYGWKQYWANYESGRAFDVRVNSNDNYRFTADVIAETKKYVNGIGYNGGIAYNDEYFEAADVGEMEAIFEALIETIQKKSITVPTKVTGDHNFDGYVTFTDPIGEYMEVKDMKGIVADGYFYQGASFAQKIAQYGTGADPEFDALIKDVVTSRMNLSSSVVDIDEFARKVLASKNQAYYNGPDDYDNSIVWWGNSYDSGNGETEVQVVGFADNDTIQYIEEQAAQGNIPSAADVVCRSYYFYGEAGGTNPNPDHTYLYFVVRVERSLTAPYNQTVTISAPASLLSMEKVFVTETYDERGNPVYTASVEHQDPARVVYEIGLWDTINAENVSYIVSKDYVNEKVNGEGSVNYDPLTDTYHFFTNDWDRTQSLESHHRGLAKATFDAAADNAFYTYQQNTLIVDKNGNAVKADPAGTAAYYVREYYEWSDNKTDGEYNAEKKTALIEVELPADANLINENGNWYIPKGAYTASTLVVNGDDAEKSENLTGTSAIVAHPHRTGDSYNSHYTVYLGNNGKLSLEADPYVPVKTSSVNLPDDAAAIIDDEGRPVKVGDILTYTVEIKNVLPMDADITVTDYIPVGTTFVEGSAGWGTAETGHTTDRNIAPDSNNVLTWTLENVPSGEVRYVSFRVEVTAAALRLSVVPGSINNTATVQIGNTAAVTTNTTHNPPYGKAVSNEANGNINGEGGFKVGDTLVYRIRFSNNAKDAEGNYIAADVKVTDKIPAGTTFISADNGGSYNSETGVVTWSFEDMAADTAKVVSFTVKINASAKIEENGTQPTEGEIYIPNTATIVIDNDPDITLITNTTENRADIGDMVITKTVAEGGDRAKLFTINLSESTGLLDGTYVLLRGDSEETVVFKAGKASVSIKHGEKLTVKGLPAGIIVNVAEDTSNIPGWRATYNTQSVTIVKGVATTVSSVTVTNTYTLEPLTVVVKGEKNMTGTLPAETVFGFVAEPDSNNPVVGDPLTGEVTVKAEGSYEFILSPKTFTTPGVYKYTIYEVSGGNKGITYDNTRYALVINVTDNGDGTMSAEATLDNSPFDLVDDAVTFGNEFTPDDVPLTIVAQKNLLAYDAESGTYIAAAPEAGQFRFLITQKGSDAVITTGTNAADGTVTFNSFYFSAEMLGGVEADGNGNKSKDFTFVISEVVPSLAKDPNMLYDLNGYEFTATLTYTNTGILVVSVNGDSDGRVDLTDDAVFTNYQNPGSVEVVPQGTKTTQDAPEGVTFSFAVINTANGNEAAAGVGDANGNITFSALSFSEIGTYTYWIYESNAGNTTNGITYDASRYLMKVEVTRNNYNRLVANVTYWQSDNDGSTDVADYTVSASAPAFHNEYNAGGYINLTATKKLTGRDLKAGEFAFKLIRQDNGGEIDGIVNSEGKITFSTLYYSENDIPESADSAVIHYVMSEVIPAVAKLPGVTYDENEYDVYVRITDNGDGTITATLVAPDGNGGYSSVGGTDTGVVFENKYTTVNGDTIKFQIKKTLEGRDLRDGEFDFQLFYGANIKEGAVPVDIASNDANGIVTFTRSIPATATPGTYVFTIKEAHGTLAGITYDTATYQIYVKITDDGNGNIVAELVDESGSVLPEENGVVDLTGEIKFANKYVPGEVFVQLEAEKTLSGRPLNEREFSFVVRKNNVNGEVVAVGNNDANGKILFSTFDITAADMAGETEKTFTYVVCESDNNIPGVTIDKTVYTVTVTVTDNGNGKLLANISYPDNAPIVFNNKYEPGNASLHFTAFKTLNGKNLLENEFTFELKDESGKVLQSVGNAKSGAVSFESITFTAEDMVDAAGNKVMEKTFVYTVSEVCGNVSGMVYDETVYTITATVTDDGRGNLTVDVKYADGDDEVSYLTFENSYTPASVEIELDGTKTIVDADGYILNDERYDLSGFEFEVYDAAGKFVTEAVSDKNGNIKFTGFEFSAAGEYRFLISEKATDRAGYTVDPTVWCVHITIAYDADNGILYEDAQYVHIAPDVHENIVALAREELTFKNVYDPADVILTLKTKKVLEGRELLDHEFAFYMVDNATGLRVAEARNNANGDINFNISYTKEGTYNYTIYESIPANKLGGVTYTTATYDVTVTVTDDGKGALVATVGGITVEGTGIADLTDSVVFENRYEADPSRIAFEAWKRLEGKALESGEFKFVVVNRADVNDKYEAVNAKNGRVVFDEITFTEVGVYVYDLYEVDSQAGGITYDSHAYTATVTVTDDKNGNLNASVVYKNSEGGEVAVPTFRNYYNADPITYTPEVKKIYEGGEMLTFDFTLSGEGFDSQTKQNDGEGNVVFDTLTFETAGIYTFTICEEINSEFEDIKWDNNVYTLTIKVIDEGIGKLEIGEVSITSDKGRNDLVFRNVHEDLITDKDVFLDNDLTVSIDGKKVEKGDVLTYTVTYKNYSGVAEDIVITDVIPEYTTYVEGSADNGGVYSDGTLTWTINGVAPDATVTVSFSVIADYADVTVVNKADVLEGSNTFETNAVTTIVVEDTVVKDVFHVAEPDISIDGESVQKGDILLYKVTYTNSDDFAADVTITDVIPEYTTYVEGSADNNGVYADGTLTWNVHLEAGESITVTFKVEVVGTDVNIVNRATVLEGENELISNMVTNNVPKEEVPEQPPVLPPQTDDRFYIWVRLLVLSMIGFVSVATLYTKRRKEQE